MRSLNHRQIFQDTLLLYFAPLVGAFRGAIREVRMTRKCIERRKARESTCKQEHR